MKQLILLLEVSGDGGQSIAARRERMLVLHGRGIEDRRDVIHVSLLSQLAHYFTCYINEVKGVGVVGVVNFCLPESVAALRKAQFILFYLRLYVPLLYQQSVHQCIMVWLERYVPSRTFICLKWKER